MGEIIELLNRISLFKKSPTFLEIASDGSFGLSFGYGKGDYDKTWGSGHIIEQELEKYLESCKG